MASNIQTDGAVPREGNDKTSEHASDAGEPSPSHGQLIEQLLEETSFLHEEIIEQPSEEQSFPGRSLFASVPTLHWNSIPDVILVKVLSHLHVADRFAASQVCWNWQHVASAAQIWHNFDYGLTDPLSSELHLDNYLRIIDIYGERFHSINLVIYSEASLQILKALTKTCKSLKCIIIEAQFEIQHSPMDLQVDFKRTFYMFLCSNYCVEELRLKNVNFLSERRNPSEPIPIGPAYAKTLRKLYFVNSFRKNNMVSLRYLVNLEELTLSPLQLQVTWIIPLAKESLCRLNIIGEAGFWECDFTQLPQSTWQEIMCKSSPLQIHLYMKDSTCKTKIISPGMPIVTLVCNDRLLLDYTQVKSVLALFIDTLTTFVDFNLTDRYLANPLVADNPMVEIVRTCHKLKTLAVKNCLCSSTLLIMAQLNPNLTDLLIRQDMVVYSLHLPQDLHLPQHVKDCAIENYTADKFAAAMSLVLKCDWAPLPSEKYFSILEKRYSAFW